MTIEMSRNPTYFPQYAKQASVLRGIIVDWLNDKLALFGGNIRIKSVALPFFVNDKNVKFDVSYRSDIRTLTIEHAGFYIYPEEGEQDFKVGYADSTTRHVRVPLDCLVTPRNMINGNVVLHETLQCELEKWLCHPFILPNGKEVSTIASKCISIQFIDAQEGV